MSKVPVIRDTPDGLQRYLAEIQKFPLLTPEEESRLAQRLRDHNDQRAFDALTLPHLRLVAKIARGYLGYNVPFADCISEGNFGLFKAVAKFDPDRGTRLATYAQWWVHAEIKQGVLHYWSMVKISSTSADRKLFFKLRQAKSSVGALEDGDLQPQHLRRIAHMLGVGEDDVVNMHRRLSGDTSLNQPLAGDDSYMELQDVLIDSSPAHDTVFAEAEELTQRKAALRQALSTLRPKELDVLTKRRLAETPLTLAELGAEYGVTRERMRQIEERAIQKLQKAMGVPETKPTLGNLNLGPYVRKRRQGRVAQEDLCTV
jgi:RNA polymerase sigma-32 factor